MSDDRAVTRFGGSLVDATFGKGEVMRALLLGFGWSGLVAGVAWNYRPAPRRVRSMSATRDDSSQSHLIEQIFNIRIIQRLGEMILHLVRRPVQPGHARRVGWTVVGATLSLFVFPPLAAILLFALFALPKLKARSIQRQRTSALLSHMPEVVDLFLLTSGAGLNVSLAVSAVGHRCPGPLADELLQAAKEASLGRRLAESLEDVVARTDEAVRPLISALVAAERYGAPLHDNLVRLAAEVRTQRRRRAEEAARRVPIKLLFPLVLCILPAFGLLTMAPLISTGLKALRF